MPKLRKILQFLHFHSEVSLLIIIQKRFMTEISEPPVRGSSLRLNKERTLKRTQGLAKLAILLAIFELTCHFSGRLGYGCGKRGVVMSDDKIAN
ncbi:MAG: hypothetical protein GC179_06165 [Anaerolineaceae bacterium]|nr:hypothetical protein [Anaerolineaceae bacterium]